MMSEKCMFEGHVVSEIIAGAIRRIAVTVYSNHATAVRVPLNPCVLGSRALAEEVTNGD
jgi:hypothetical protein